METPPHQPQKMFNAPAIVINAIVLLAIIHVARFVLPEEFLSDLFAWAAFIPARYGVAADGITYIFPGEPLTDFTSIITYGLLHGDGLHLIMNCVWLLAFGTPVARQLSSIRFVLFSLVCSIFGALVFLVMNVGELAIMIGASAAISGLMGAAGRIMFAPKLLARDEEGRLQFLPSRQLAGFGDRRLIMFVVIWLGFTVLIGATNVVGGGMSVHTIAWEAHLGGFLAGLFLYDLFVPRNLPILRA